MKRSFIHSMIILAGVTSLALGQTPPSTVAATPTVTHRHTPVYGHPFLLILHQLNLTAEQKTQISSIVSSARPQMQSLGKNMNESMEALMTTPPGDAGYAALVENAQTNALAHIKLLVDTQAQIYAVLTPEQQAKIPGIVATQKAKWKATQQKRLAAPAPVTQP